MIQNVVLLLTLLFGARVFAINCIAQVAPMLYDVTVEQVTYQSGFIAPVQDSESENNFLHDVRLYAGEGKDFAEALSASPLRDQMLALHAIAYLQSYRGRAELGGHSFRYERLEFSKEAAESMFKELTDIVLNHSSEDLLPYWDELRVVVTDLAIAKGGRDASLAVQLRMADMAEEIPKIRQHVTAIRVGIVEDLRSADAATPERLQRFIQEFPRIMNYMSLTDATNLVGKYVAEVAQVGTDRIQQEPWRDMLRAYIDVIRYQFGNRVSEMDDQAKLYIYEAIILTLRFSNIYPWVLTAAQQRDLGDLVRELGGNGGPPPPPGRTRGRTLH